jgi:hypothetical protein
MVMSHSPYNTMLGTKLNCKLSNFSFRFLFVTEMNAGQVNAYIRNSDDTLSLIQVPPSSLLSLLLLKLSILGNSLLVRYAYTLILGTPPTHWTR